MDRHFYCPPVTIGGKRIIQRQSLADSACQWRQFMTSSSETPQSHKSRRTNRHLIRFQGVPSHCAVHSSLHIELNSGFVGPPPPIFLFLLPSPKINRSYFPASTLKTWKKWRGASLTQANTFHLLQVNSNWLLTFTYPPMQRNHTHIQPGGSTKCILFRVWYPSPLINEGKSLCH